MFNGIVETISEILDIQCENGCKHLSISQPSSFHDLKIGDSIAVNGVCLTITTFTANAFCVTLVPETLRSTNFNDLKVFDIVNLERPLKANDRIGGHFVQGHVDAIGKILEIDLDNSEAKLAKISIPPHLAKYIVAKGYISLDGMSITIIEAGSDWFSVTFIPHTQAATITKQYRKDTLINIEVDMMGKYIEKILGENIYVRN